MLHIRRWTFSKITPTRLCTLSEIAVRAVGNIVLGKEEVSVPAWFLLLLLSRIQRLDCAKLLCHQHRTAEKQSVKVRHLITYSEIKGVYDVIFRDTEWLGGSCHLNLWQIKQPLLISHSIRPLKDHFQIPQISQRFSRKRHLQTKE